MKIKLLILFSIFMLLFVSCEKDMKWINSNDSKIDQKETDKICQDAKAECGYIVSNYNGVSFEMFCGKCKEGYKCDDYSNTCQDIDECSDPLLNKCSSNTRCANEEGTYSCICKENYSGKDCVPDTRLKDCENLPVGLVEMVDFGI